MGMGWKGKRYGRLLQGFQDTGWKLDRPAVRASCDREGPLGIGSTLKQACHGFGRDTGNTCSIAEFQARRTAKAQANGDFVAALVLLRIPRSQDRIFTERADHEERV